jgi:ribosomal protein S18 acetylase RimI-like enzyme
MIRKAHTQDLEGVLQMLFRCRDAMRSAGIFQWNEHYPNRLVLSEDIKKGSLHVMIIKDSITGCISIGTEKDPEYQTAEWLTEDSLHLYVHRLAVDPAEQGKGHARKLMDFAENMARQWECASVRLDTFSQNKRNLRFYEKRGYTRLQNVYFPLQSEQPFYCYELLLE